MNTTSAVDPTEVWPTEIRQQTVLVVEDEILIRSAIAGVLRDEGVCVIEAMNADEALCVLQSAAVDLVLTDVTMPGLMDGLDLAERIKATRPALPVVIASAMGPQRDISGFSDGFFLKPYDFTAMVDFVRGLIMPAGGDVRA